MTYVYRVFLPLIGVGILLVGWVRYQETAGIFFPTQYPEERLDRLPDSVEFVEFDAPDGVKLTGLLKRGRPDSPAIVFTHGNAGHMLDRLPWLRNGLPEGWTGLILDYRGYGLSEGEPSVGGIKTDGRAAVDYVLRETEADSLYLYGRSLGVPVAAYASQFNPTEGIILVSGFPSAREVVPHVLPIPGLKYLTSVDLDTVEYLRTAEETHGPMRKLIVHGSEDRILPVSLGHELHEQLSEPKQKYIVEGAGHNNLRAVAGTSYLRTLEGFLRSEE